MTPCARRGRPDGSGRPLLPCLRGEPSVTELIDYVEFCGVPGAPAGDEGAVPEVSVRQLADELAAGDPPLLVDVRGPEERAIASIPGAVPIHLDRFRSGAPGTICLGTVGC